MTTSALQRTDMPSRKDAAEFQRRSWRSILVAALVVMLVRSVSNAGTASDPDANPGTGAHYEPTSGRINGKNRRKRFLPGQLSFEFSRLFCHPDSPLPVWDCPSLFQSSL